MTKQELLALWESNKEDYANQEIGSGTQSFVRKVLESSEVFNLDEGSFQETNYSKKSDYIAEASKDRNRADFVIRISDEIQIPIEVEKYGNIKAGIKQLARYQAVWDMKYGILTDGYEWRFYIGTRVYGIELEKLLDDSFQIFWQDYTKTDNYYRFYFEQDTLFKPEPKEINESEIGLFFDNITKLIRKFRDKLNLEKYFTDAKDQKDREKRATEITYAYIIQFILYKVLVDNDFSIFKDRFDEIREAITDALKSPSGLAFNGILNLITKMSEQISENIYRPFAQEQAFISNKLKEVLSSPKNNIMDIAPWLDMFVFIDGFTFQNIKNEIFGHVYENYLKELYSEENRGQYFTHPAVVDFMLEEIGYNQQTLTQNNFQDISIIDPSCGSGTFLYKIADIIIDSFGSDVDGAKKELSSLIHENVFGLDIEEFPLYLAEMSILMRMLPYIVNEQHNNAMDKKIKVFKTRDSVAEFIGETQASDVLFTTQLQLGYDSFMRDEDNLSELKDSLKGTDWKQANDDIHVPRRRFDYVIGNPPYISAKECYEQNVLTYKLLKDKKIKLNNIHGINLHSTPMYNKPYAPPINIHTMFIALGQGLLKDDGKIAYIIPQTMLSSVVSDTIRYHLAKNTTIEKVLIFNDFMFINRGIKTKRNIQTSSLVFIVKKTLPSTTHKVLFHHIYGSIVDNKLNISKDSYKIKYDNNYLIENISSWLFLISPKEKQNIRNKYIKNTNSMSVYYQHLETRKNNFYFDRGLKFYKDKAVSNNSNQKYELVRVQKEYKTAISLHKYIDWDYVVVPFGSQGQTVFECKYKIIWSYTNMKNFHFSDKQIIIDYNHIIISSNDEKEMLYLYIILTSLLSDFILKLHNYIPTEKDYSIGITAIKQFIRVPIITDKNQHLKDRLIGIAQQILDAEKPLFKDVLDISHIMVQKFDSIDIVNDELVFTHGLATTTVKINSNIQRITYNLALYRKEMKRTKKDLALISFKNFPCVDNILIDELMHEANTIIYELYEMNQDDIDVIEGRG